MHACIYESETNKQSYFGATLVMIRADDPRPTNNASMPTRTRALVTRRDTIIVRFYVYLLS